MKRFLLTILLAALLAACSSEPEGATVRAVYHWKTTYNPTQYEQQWLRDHRVTRLYLRVFDVDVHDIEKVAPIATTRFLQPLPDSMEIVPVVYITNEAMDKMGYWDGKVFAHKIADRVVKMAECNGFELREMQVDCDWTAHTKSDYYDFCEELRNYLHEKGILHLDIKPSNIMMEKGKNVRLMDLGIAYVSQDNSSTASSGVMGTPRYAAPEQFCSNPEDKDSALSKTTDIYEAGVTLYELLSRKNPFVASTIAEFKDLHNKKTLPPIKSISSPVFQVLLKATSINPDDRYKSASEMKAALKRALTPKQEPWWKRYWWIGAIIGALILLTFIITLIIR